VDGGDGALELWQKVCAPLWTGAPGDHREETAVRSAEGFRAGDHGRHAGAVHRRAPLAAGHAQGVPAVRESQSGQGELRLVGRRRQQSSFDRVSEDVRGHRRRARAVQGSAPSATAIMAGEIQLGSFAGNSVLPQPDTQQKLLSQGGEPVGSTPEQFQKMIVTEIAQWGKVVKAANIKAD
jgi:hypothetical protein